MSKRSIVACLAATVSCLVMAIPAAGQTSPPTLWNFLGIPQGANMIHAQLFNRRGNFPGLEKKPPLKTIADPANLESTDPAIKAAAEIKQAEDLKKQKIKAIKYLADIGCGCYNKDGKVTKALVAAMDDCTEDVRLAAVEAIKEAASDDECPHCSQRNCCSEPVTDKLAEIAYGVDDSGCYIEPSERVREAAEEALGICCPTCQYAAAPIEDEGIEQPELAPLETPDSPVERPQLPESEDSTLPPPPTPAADQETRAPAVPVDGSRPSSRRRYQLARFEAAQPEETPEPAVLQPEADPQPAGLAPVFERAKGLVAHVDAANRRVELHIHGDKTLRVGSTLKVYHEFLTGRVPTAVLEVVESSPGYALARPVRQGRMPHVARGDEIEAWR